MDKNISANLTGFLTTFLVISDGFLGLRYRKKSYDNSPDPKTPMNEIYVEDIVDPELKLIGIKLNVFFVVTWSKFNQSIYSHVIFVTSQKHKWVISNIIW